MYITKNICTYWQTANRSISVTWHTYCVETLSVCEFCGLVQTLTHGSLWSVPVCSW